MNDKEITRKTPAPAFACYLRGGAKWSLQQQACGIKGCPVCQGGVAVQEVPKVSL